MTIEATKNRHFPSYIVIVAILFCCLAIVACGASGAARGARTGAAGGLIWGLIDGDVVGSMAAAVWSPTWSTCRKTSLGCGRVGETSMRH